MPIKEAYEGGIKAMAETLVSLVKNQDQFPDLSALSECNSYNLTQGNCNDWCAPCRMVSVKLPILSKKEAAKAAFAYRKDNNKPNPLDQAFETLTCSEQESKEFYIFGLYDDFDTSNVELVNPQGQLAAYYNTFPLHSNYDNNTSSLTIPTGDIPAESGMMMFAETMDNLPANMTQGRFAVGMKLLEGAIFNENIYFGLTNETLNDGTIFNASSLNHIPNSFTYYQDLDQLNFQNSSQNWLQHIQSGNTQINTLALGLIDIDYLAVAACVPKEKPTGIPAKEVPIKISCDAEKGESLTIVWGGIGDDFASPIDPATPAPNISGTIAYDQPVEKVAQFADRITLPNMTITKMEVMVNSRASAAGAANDLIKIGDFTNSTGAVLPVSAPSIPTLNGGNAHIFEGTTSVMPSGTLLSLANNSHYLDLLVGDYSEVDSVRVAMCVVKDPKEGDISINKKAVESYSKDGVNYGIFEISFTGTLPLGETLVIEESVPNGATLTQLNAPSSWNCTPSTPISGAATLTCELSATNGAIGPFPSISLTMSTTQEKLQNCASISKKTQDVYYNNNSDNDKSCDTATFKPREGGCTNLVSINLRDAISWVDEDGNHPTQNNVFSTYPPNPAWANVIWDGDMNWFDFGSTSGAEHKLKIDFCACGDTYIKIEDMKSDNFGKIYLDDDPTPSSYTNPAYIVSRSNGSSQSTMASWGPTVSGSLMVSGTGSDIDHTLHFDVKNGFGPSGGAVDGYLEFYGKLGKCQGGTTTDNDWVVLYDEAVAVYLYPDFTLDSVEDNTTVIVVEQEAYIDYSLGFPEVVTPMPIVVNAGDLHVVDTTPQSLFGDTLSQGYSVVIGCVNGYISAAVQGAAAPLVMEASKACIGTWMVSQ